MWKDREITILNFNYGMYRLRIFFCIVTVVYYFFLGEIEKDPRLSCLPILYKIEKVCVFNLIKLKNKLHRMCFLFSKFKFRHFL